MPAPMIVPGQQVRVALRDERWFFWRSAVVLQPQLPDGCVGVIVPGELLPRALRSDQVFAGPVFSFGLLSLEPPQAGRA